MAAATMARESSRKPGEIVRYALGAVQVWKGTLAVARSDGYAYPLRAPAAEQADVFIGVFDESANNSAGVAGALFAQVRKTGVHHFAMAAPGQANVSTAVYGADNQTVSETSANAVLVGYMTGVVDSGDVAVRIDRAVQ